MFFKKLFSRSNLELKDNDGIVKQIKDSNPNLEIIINGGITKIEEIKKHLNNVDGVMIGRSIYHSPYFLEEIEKEIFNNDDVSTREEVVNKVNYMLDIVKNNSINEIEKN